LDHLCVTCRTSQAFCERFTSGFTYLPDGALMRRDGRKGIVWYCPKHT
jgi:hypothetical protein